MWHFVGVAFEVLLFPFSQLFVVSKKAIFLFQLDYFGVAGVAHTLLHGNYMKLVKKGVDSYVPNGSLKRWWDCNLWTDFFHQFLNINEAKLPDIKSMREKFEASFINLQQRSGFDTAATELNKLLLKNA